MAEIHTLKKDGITIYPQTHVDAVLDSNGKTVSALINEKINEKQDKIDDLDEIRSGAELGKTAIQAGDLPNTLPNPNSLIVQKSGTTIATYDGSSETTVNISFTASDLGLSSALKYCGITTTSLTDGSTTNPIKINNVDHTATSGCVVFFGDKEFIFNGSVWEEFGYPIDLSSYASTTWVENNYKPKQTAVSSPTANGNSTSFIDTISQNANGVITATKKSIDLSRYLTTDADSDDISLSSNFVAATYPENTGEGVFTELVPGESLSNAIQTLDKNLVEIVEETLKKEEIISQSLTELNEGKANTSELANVAFSGSYNDLSNKPTIPSYSEATTTKTGLMSAEDKAKLDNLGSGNFSGILNLKNRDAIHEAQLSLKDGESKTYIISDEFGNFPSPNIETIYLDNMDDLMDLLYRGNDLALRHIINNGEAYYEYMGIWSSENIRSHTKLPKFHLQTAKVGDLVTIIRHDFDSDVFYSNYIDFNSISNNNTSFQAFKAFSGFASSSDGEFIKHLIKTGKIYSAYSNPREDSSVIMYPLAIDGKVQFYTAQITPNIQKMYSGEFWTGNMTGPGIYSYITSGRPDGSEDGEFYVGYVSPDGTQTLVSMKDPNKVFVRSGITDGWVQKTVGVGKKTIGTGEIFNDYINNFAHADHAHAEGQNCKAVGWNSHAEGFTTIAGTENTGNSHAEGNNTQAIGNNSHAEGVNTIAEGNNSHAEGDLTKASNWNSHAEGYRTHALGNGSHAEGNSDGIDDENYWNVALGMGSHAEGRGTRAEGEGSHAEGACTWAKEDFSHAEGVYNYYDIPQLIHSVGIGAGALSSGNESYRTNAHAITLDGKHYIYGVGGYEGKGIENATDLASCINDYDEVYLKIGQNNEILSLTIPNNILSSKKPYVLLTYEYYSGGYYYKRDIKIQKHIEYSIPENTQVFSITLNWLLGDTIYTLCINPNTMHSLHTDHVLSKDDKTKLDGLATVATSGSYNDLSDVPEALKNPYLLTIQTNGTTLGTYDGSSASTLNITAASLGLSSALKYCGVTTTNLVDDSTVSSIIINGTSHTATAGCVVFYGDKEYVYNGTKWEELGYPVDLSSYATTVWVENNYKAKQEAVSCPNADGSAVSFIDTISQNANGVITVTKKNIDFSGYKTTQSAVSSPSASGNSTSFIDTISQDANGKITVTKKNVDFSKYTEKTDLSQVATTGSYNDLSDLPNIPAEVTETTVEGWGFTKNTGTITGITMNGSSKGTSGVVDLGTVLTSHQDISGKQDKLTSGSNIKTINGESVLGSGNISVGSNQNLVKNSNFDLFNGDYLKYFTKGTGVELEKSNVVTNGYLGNNSFRISYSMPNTVIRYELPFDINPGDTFTLSCMARTSELNTTTNDQANIGFIVRLPNPNPETLGSSWSNYWEFYNSSSILWDSWSNADQTDYSRVNVPFKFSSANTWEKKEISFKYLGTTPYTASNRASITIYKWWNESNGTTTRTGDISQIKLETGLFSTPYLKHSDDISELSVQLLREEISNLLNTGL